MSAAARGGWRDAPCLIRRRDRQRRRLGRHGPRGHGTPLFLSRRGSMLQLASGHATTGATRCRDQLHVLLGPGVTSAGKLLQLAACWIAGTNDHDNIFCCDRLLVLLVPAIIFTMTRRRQALFLLEPMVSFVGIIH